MVGEDRVAIVIIFTSPGAHPVFSLRTTLKKMGKLVWLAGYTYKKIVAVAVMVVIAVVIVKMKQ